MFAIEAEEMVKNENMPKSAPRQLEPVLEATRHVIIHFQQLLRSSLFSCYNITDQNFLLEVQVHIGGSAENK